MENNKKRRYSVIRNYKKFKKEYLYFIVFVKCKDVYYTFDADAKIMLYLDNVNLVDNKYIIDKKSFKSILNLLLNKGINVVLVGWKNTREYYSNKGNNYMYYKKKSKLFYKNFNKST